MAVSCVLVCYNLTLQLIDQGERDGIWIWHRINRLFNWLPLAALIEKKIICMHGGIGRSINHVEQIESLQRPITMEAGSIVLMDLLWSVHVLDGLFYFFVIAMYITRIFMILYLFSLGPTPQKMTALKDCVQMLEVLV